MLHEAARKETKEKFQRLVSKLGKASVHVKERDYEQTPLHCACDSGNQEVASLLLEKYKVEVNIVDKNGWTPLHSACNSGKLAIVELLLNKGAFPRALTNEGTSPLHYFVRHNYGADVINAYKVLQMMISKGADVNCQNKHGDSPLHQASQRGRDQNVLFLLNNKANANIGNKQGDTPLHTAIRVGQVAVAKMLVAMGQADVNSKIPPATQSPLEVAQQIAPDLAKDLLGILRDKEEKEKAAAESKLTGGKTLVRAATLASVTSSISPADRLSLRGKDIERERSTDMGSERSAGSDRGSQERLSTNLPGHPRQSRDLTNVIGPGSTGSTSGLATSVTSAEDLRRRGVPQSPAVAESKSARLSANVTPSDGSDKSDGSQPGSTIAATAGSPVNSLMSSVASSTSSSTSANLSVPSSSGSHIGHRKGTSSSGVSVITTAASPPVVSVTPAVSNTPSSTVSSVSGAASNTSTVASNQTQPEEEQQPIACVNCAKDYSSISEDLLVAQQVHFHTKAPYRWDTLGGPEEQKQRGRLSYDLCVIDNEQFFIKGLLELRIISDAPVNPYSKTPPNMLVFGIWVKVTKDFFNHVVANWNTAYRDKDPKSKSLGELASVLPSYPDTLNLQVLVHTRERGKRFLVEVQPADHPLSFEQDCGVAPHRIKEMIRYLRKPSLLTQM